MVLAGTRRSRSQSPSKASPAKRNRTNKDEDRDFLRNAIRQPSLTRSPGNGKDNGKGKAKENDPVNPFASPHTTRQSRSPSRARSSKPFKDDEAIAETVIRASTPFAGAYKPDFIRLPLLRAASRRDSRAVSVLPTQSRVARRDTPA